MTTLAVSELLYQLDSAFDGTPWHSLLGNLRTVQPDDWLWVPPAGHRSIQHIVQHIGACKFMYENYAFGDAHLVWDDPMVQGRDALSTVADAVAWLQARQARLRQSIAALGDDELLRPRKTFWGDMKETRWLITNYIQHDLYHTGEINHIRSLHQQNDDWGYED